MVEKGLYVAYACGEDAFGFSFSCVYIAKDKDFQISLMIGSLALAIGCKF